MSYQVIARKFRPKSFDDVLGQEHVAKTLQRAIETGRIHHAFLFTGSRGVGKTSMARILAKALNAPGGPSTNPDLESKIAQEIDQGINLDVREIDGASNTGVDDVRELRENIRFLPTNGNYRVFIIDEVHMLSTSAFNALLKTLEEPPEHVIFIFATTEPHKIPETILSRCQRYDFRLLTHKQIFQQLRNICETENIKIADAALHLLASEAAGSMRDAETLLEQVISFVDRSETISIDTVTMGLGLVDRKVLLETLQAIFDHSGTKLLEVVARLCEYGHDLKHFTQDLLRHLRNISVIQACGKQSPDENAQLLDLPDEEIAFLTEIASNCSEFECQRLYRLLMKDYYEISRSNHARMALEMAFLRLVQTPPLNDISQAIEDLKAMRDGQAPAPAPTPKARMQLPRQAPTPASIPAARKVSSNPQVNANEANQLWNQLISALKKTSPSIAFSLLETSPIACSAKRLAIGVAQGSIVQEKLARMSTQEAIRQAMQSITGDQPKLEITVDPKLKPAKTLSQQEIATKKKLAAELEQDPTVQKMQEVLGAQIEDVRPLETRSSEPNQKTKQV